MSFSKVRPYLVLKAELGGEIPEWFIGSTWESKMGISLFASRLLDDNTFKSIREAGCESNKYSSGETNQEQAVPDLTKHAKPSVDVEIRDFHSPLSVSQRLSKCSPRLI